MERNQELFELRCSIEKEGVLVPLMMRKNPHGDGYETRIAKANNMSKRFQTSAHLYTILISKQTYLRSFNTNKDRIKAI